MKRLDYNFSEYQRVFNKMARAIIAESCNEGFDAEQVSQQIDEAQVTYNKIQKILNCPEMIKSHAYLYALDMENVDECDKAKIDKLYDLGVARGVIQDEPEDSDGEQDDRDDSLDVGGDEICGGPDDALTGQEMTPGALPPPKTSTAFTVLYSAMKDGQIKTGEYFSSAVDSDAAKSDCIASLSPLGYSNIRVLGIEQANDAVDFGNSTLDSLDEDDSKEYEEQETGSGGGSKTEANPPETDGDAKSEEKPKDDPKTQKKDEKPVEPAENPDAEDSTEKSDEQPKNDNGADSEKPAENGENTEEEPKKLTQAEKQVLRDEYVGMFKAELQAMKLEKSPNEMNNKEKADFWGKIVKKWTKQDPEEFMSSKEIEKLNDTVIKAS